MVSMRDVELIYKSEMLRAKALVEHVVSVQPEDFGCPPDGERGLPGEDVYMRSGWSEKMLGRYFFAGKIFCSGKNVLDLCSGFGWGARILANYAKNVSTLEIDEDIVRKASVIWNVQNVHWGTGNCLAIEERWDGEHFDVVVAMEAIEHFTRNDGLTLLRGVGHVLKKGGAFIASSYFPETTEEAERSRSTNPFHLHIYTAKEILECCSGIFESCEVIGNMFVVAKK